jgi:hypothetical protein
MTKMKENTEKKRVEEQFRGRMLLKLTICFV